VSGFRPRRKDIPGRVAETMMFKIIFWSYSDGWWPSFTSALGSWSFNWWRIEVRNW
jgi:hypothetical protein